MGVPAGKVNANAVKKYCGIPPGHKYRCFPPLAVVGGWLSGAIPVIMHRFTSSHFNYPGGGSVFMSLPIYLIGARGCGKTTIGHLLSQTLGYAFNDTDHHLQSSLQCTIAQIVAEQGWESFRDKESASLIQVTTASAVIATGGGIILRPDNCQHMREHGRVFWLKAEPQELAKRLTVDPEAGQRPTLTGRPITEEMSDVLKIRSPLYSSTAHHIIDASRPPQEVVDNILQVLSQQRAG